MPAKRSRTLQWRRCLEQIQERNGALEIAVARDPDGSDSSSQLVWRVRVLSLNDQEIITEQPQALGQTISLRVGIQLQAVIAVGQNRWTFSTEVLGFKSHRLNQRQDLTALRLRMPTRVDRCQRRDFYRIDTAALVLPDVELWPLLDPKSVVVAERANELAFERDMADGERSPSPKHDLDLSNDEIMPEVGPKFHGTLMNIGGGGVGLRIAPEHQQIIARHRLYWMRILLPPELETPICASAKLVHTHLESDQHTYAGYAFDFTFNPGHQRFVVDQICRYSAVQQRRQFQRLAAEPSPDE